jgi:hypothetical protein
VESPGAFPRHTLLGELAAHPDGVPDIEDVTLLADRLGTDRVPLGPRIEQDHANSPTRQQQRRRLADWPVAEHGDGAGRRLLDCHEIL